MVINSPLGNYLHQDSEERWLALLVPRLQTQSHPHPHTTATTSDQKNVCNVKYMHTLQDLPQQTECQRVSKGEELWWKPVCGVLQ